MFGTQPQPRVWSTYDACACVEGFDGLEHDEETTLAAWQSLIDSGAVWSLQGWYGRQAQSLINHGHCITKEI